MSLAETACWVGERETTWERERGGGWLKVLMLHFSSNLKMFSSPRSVTQKLSGKSLRAENIFTSGTCKSEARSLRIPVWSLNRPFPLHIPFFFTDLSQQPAFLSSYSFPPRFSPMMTAIIKETFYGCSPTHYQMFRGHSSLYTQPCIHQRKKKPHRNIHVDWFFILIVHFKVKVEKKKKQ